MGNLPFQPDPHMMDKGRYPVVSPPDPGLGAFTTVLRQHRFLIALCVLLGVALGGLYTLLVKPVYEATAVLRFELEQVNLPQLVQQLSTENRINTEIEVLRGRSAAAAVIDSLGLRARLVAPPRVRVSEVFTLLRVAPVVDTLTLILRSRGSRFTIWRPDSLQGAVSAGIGDTVQVAGVTLALAPGALGSSELRLEVISLDEAVRSFESGLNVSRPARDADLIAVRTQTGDPVQAAGAANLLAQHLIAGRQGVQRTRTGSTIRYLTQQLDTLGARLRTAEDALRAYRERAGVVDAQADARTQVERLAQIRADRGALEAERQALAQLLQQMRSDSARALPGGQQSSRRLVSFPTLLRNAAASELLGALASVENERSALLMRRGPQDPDVQILTARVHELEAQLQGIAETYLQGLTNQVAGLESVARGFGGALDSLPEKEVQTARLERDVGVQKELYTLIQTRLKEAQITQAMEDPTVRIVDPAVVPERPIRPIPLLNLTLSLVVGLLIGVAISLAHKLADRSVRSREDALLAAGLPVLGAIPRVERGFSNLLPRRRRRREKISPGLVLRGIRKADGTSRSGTRRAARSIVCRLVTGLETPTRYVESFNLLHANLILAYREQPPKVLVFTSPLPGEGKTLAVVNFALTLAAQGLRVLLIDADLRCGLVNAVFDCAREPGFAELLAGTARFEDGARHIAVGESGALVILPSGARVPAPGRLLAIERVREVLEPLIPQYDLVLIDTPPVNLLADAALLGSAADAVLLVVRAGHTKIEALRYAMDQLTAARAPVIGTLLNDIDLRRHADDDGSYRYLAEVERYDASRR